MFKKIHTDKPTQEKEELLGTKEKNKLQYNKLKKDRGLLRILDINKYKENK